MSEPADRSDANLDATQRSELGKLLAELTTEADVFAALGRSLGASATGEDPEERGRSVFARRMSEIKSLICGNGHVKAYCVSANYSDTTGTAVTVAGVLLAGKFGGLNVLLVACLVARIGLRNLCADVWAASNPA